MRAATISMISALVTIGVGACARSGEASEPPVGRPIAATAALGPAVGETIPFDSPLRDSQGRDVRLADLAGDAGVVLVFHRSADWCPACQEQLAGLARIEDRLGEAGYRIAAVSIDSPDTLHAFAARSGVRYPLLSDQGGTLIERLGLADPIFSSTSFAAGAARPAAIVADADGRIRASIVASDYRRAPEAADLLAAVGQIRA